MMRGTVITPHIKEGFDSEHVGDVVVFYFVI